MTQTRFFFPWRTYLALFYLCIFFEIFAGLGFWFLFRTASGETSAKIILFTLVSSAAGAFLFFLPLRRILLKAIRMSNKGRVWGVIRDEEKFFKSANSVFRELDVALNLIRQKLKRRGMQLAHEREEAETLITFLEDALVSFSPDGRIKYFNSRFANLFLQVPGEMGRLQALDSLYVNEVIQKADLTETFRSVFQEKKLLRTQYFREDPDRHFSVLVSPLRDDLTQEIYGAIALFHDISDIKQVEKMRMEFVENASHELRTPLTSIKGFLSTVQEDFTHERLEHIPHFLQIISKNVERLNELVNDMLTLSRLENQSDLNKELMHPDALTADVIERLAPMAAEKNIRIQYSAQITAFMGDEEKVERVLLNLIGNGIKYIGESGMIDVRWNLAPDRKTAILSVHDNGPGIPQEHLGRLFERFYRIDRGRSRDVGGTGLGLSIVKHIMQSHGGRVFAESSLGKGSTFVCEFPLEN